VATEEGVTEWQEKIQATPAELMNLYAATLDPDTRSQIRKGVMLKVARQYGRDVGLTIRSDDGTPELEAIFANLTQQQKDVAKALFDALNRPAVKAALNRTAVALWGRELAASDAYWPRKRDLTGRDQAEQSLTLDQFVQNPGNVAIEHMGFTKDRISNKRPLVTDDIFRIFDAQVRLVSTFAHLAIPLANARTLLNFNREGIPLSQSIRDRFGDDLVNRELDMLQRVAGLKTHGDEWTPVVRWLEHRARNASVAILWGRLSSIVFNRAGGSLLMAAELAHEAPAALPRFIAQIRLPSKAYWLQAGKRAARAEIMANGFFWNRWRKDMVRVQANLPSERGIDAYASAARLRWRQIQDMGLAPMAEAETKNAVEAYLALQAAGYSKADALEAVERMTRRSQNPSSALDETAMYEDVKKSGWGILLPFTGQPTVAASMLTRDMLAFRHARRSGAGRGKALRDIGVTTFALLLSVALTALVRNLIRSASKGFPPEKDDREKEQEIWNVGQELLDLVVPGAGRGLDVVQSLMNRGEIRDMSLITRSVSQTWRGFQDIGKGSEAADDERVERGVIRLLEGVSTWGGLPIGGPLQAAQIVAGAAGEPLGQPGLEEQGPPAGQRPRRPAQPLRRRPVQRRAPARRVVSRRRE
jgi:hypothetical protein